ncbi:HlyIII-domain-containing protein [Bimuria novae-zelandiae CBS 107.79]|uniref:HlyIII-domain-containing protein n=1 Tax=Bimuria novae-zelandiae CBS 107.79 TaxID=1447943 RepID=A0A6A5VUX3_9PLEO|nr:HlyIII-domain-containing protein [Bimuria novae-zelandiae CBS 107.79]
MDTTKEAANTLAKESQKLEQKIEEKLTVLWNDLPPWQRDNHYIHSGYRLASSSFSRSLSSLRYLHNETVNIYTHLLGSTLFLLLSFSLYRTLSERYPTATPEDVLVFSCFFAGAVGCLSMSATYHTISNHSEAVAKWGNKLDYLGIVGLIWGSFVPVLYYGFRTQPDLMKAYLGMITTLSLTTAITSTHHSFRTPTLRPLRATMFVLTGLSALVPVIHAARLYGLATLRSTIALDYVLLQGALYILGAAIYAFRVPERLWPGRFDIWGSSHQIFHVLVVAAAGVHLGGLVRAFDVEPGGFRHSL